MLEIEEIGTIAERISLLIDHFASGNKAAFGRAADLQSGLLAGIVGGRQSKPSFEVIQKILTGYPTVSADWLLFGRGPVLRNTEVPLAATEINDFITEKQWQEIVPKVIERIANTPDWKKQVALAQAKGNALAEAENRVYLVANEYPWGETSQLSNRLSISEEQAKSLVSSGAIRSKHLIDEGIYIVPERFIRVYLGQS